MRLIESRQEQDIRADLKKGHHALFQNSENVRLLEVLQKTFPKMQTAYVLEWIPEQGEDIFGVLIDTDTISWVELDRVNIKAEPIIESGSVSKYRRKLKKLKLIKLLVALDLAQTDMDRNSGS